MAPESMQHFFVIKHVLCLQNFLLDSKICIESPVETEKIDIFLAFSSHRGKFNRLRNNSILATMESY